MERSFSIRPFWIDAACVCGDFDPGESELEADVVFGYGVVDGEDALVLREQEVDGGFYPVLVAHLGNFGKAFADVLLVFGFFESDRSDSVGATGYLALAGSDFGDDFRADVGIAQVVEEFAVCGGPGGQDSG